MFSENRTPVERLYTHSIVYGAAKLSDEDDAPGYFRCRLSNGRYVRPSGDSGRVTTDIRQDLVFDVLFMDLGCEEYGKPGSQIFHLDER